MKTWTVLLSCVLLAACAAAPPAPPPPALFDDALFAPASQRIDARDVFALSDEMRHYAAQRITGPLRHRGPQRALVDALYTQSELKLEYDAEMTRNAAEAFEARAGNCLSLVIMTAAFAKEIGLKLQYQSVFLDEVWSRSGDLYFASGHVNLTLGKRLDDVRSTYDADEAITIDFIPPPRLRGQRMRVIDERTIIAMYMNNKAAEALAAGRLDDAYWWAREAVVQAPAYMSAYNTLGLVYLRHRHPVQAERALAYALQREPANTQVMANLVTVLQRLGRHEESQQLAQRLARLEPYPPFHFFDLGQAALKRGDYQTAKTMFEREVDRAGEYHEFHFWLAVAHAGLGDLQQARRELSAAMQTSTTRGERDLYAAKLARINAYRLQ